MSLAIPIAHDATIICLEKGQEYLMEDRLPEDVQTGVQIEVEVSPRETASRSVIATVEEK